MPLYMTLLAPLLETQDLDLAADAARKRARELPERAELPILAERIARLDQELSTAAAARRALETEEDELGRAVSQIAAEIEAAELERYSGKHKGRDAADQHDVSQAALRERKAALEEREMELLEAVEEIEGRISAHESEIDRCRGERERLEDVIREAEAEVQVEVARLGEARGGLVGQLPPTIVAAYERVRGQERNRGRGAAALTDKRCGACRIELPSLECRKMLEAPADALIQCPQCRRVLVREG